MKVDFNPIVGAMLALASLCSVASASAQPGHAEVGGSLSGHVFAIEFTPNGEFIVLAHGEGVAVINVSTSKIAYSLDTKFACRELSTSSDSESIFLIYDDGPKLLSKAGIWSFKTKSTIDQEIKYERENVSFRSLIESPEGRKFVTIAGPPGEAETDYLFCNVSEMGSIEEIFSRAPMAFRQTVFVDEKTAVTIRNDSHIDFYETKEWSVTRSIELLNGKAKLLDVAGQSLIVSGIRNSGESSLDVFWKFDVNSKSAIESNEFSETPRDGEMCGLLLTPDGSMVVTQTNRIVHDRARLVSSFMPVLEARDFVTGKLKWSEVASKTGFRNPMTISPDGKLLAYSDEDSLVIRDAQSGELISDVKWHQQ